MPFFRNCFDFCLYINVLFKILFKPQKGKGLILCRLEFGKNM